MQTAQSLVKNCKGNYPTGQAQDSSITLLSVLRNKLGISRVSSLKKILPVLSISLLSLLIIFLLIVSDNSQVIASEINGVNIITREEQKLDTSLANASTIQYLQPTKIMISRVQTKSEDLSTDSSKWVDALYYYSITRQGFADIPFNYLIDRNGNIYQGRGGWAGAVPELTVPQGIVLIGYLSNGTDITYEASGSMSQLISNLSKTFGIASSDVQVAQLDYIKQPVDPEKPDGPYIGKISTLIINDNFASNITRVLATTAFYTTKSEANYIAEIKDLTYEKEVKAGEKLTVSFKLVNKNDFPWFTNKDYIYLTTNNGKSSQYAVNGVWDTFSKPMSITDKTILPGEEISMSFDMQAGLGPVEESIETFKLIIEPNKGISNSSLEIRFKTTKGDKSVVKILPTGSSVLSVRNCGYVECAIIGYVDVGAYYEFIEASDSGWYKIKFGNNEVGWVGSKYAEKI